MVVTAGDALNTGIAGVEATGTGVCAGARAGDGIDRETDGRIGVADAAVRTNKDGLTLGVDV